MLGAKVNSVSLAARRNRVACERPIRVGCRVHRNQPATTKASITSNTFSPVPCTKRNQNVRTYVTAPNTNTNNGKDKVGTPEVTDKVVITPISAHAPCQQIGSVTTEADVRQVLAQMKLAQKEFEGFTQEQVDKIFKKVAMKANVNRMEIAEWAITDTGMGVMEDKVVKNHFASEFIYNKYKDTKTVGTCWSELVQTFIGMPPGCHFLIAVTS